MGNTPTHHEPYLEIYSNSNTTTPTSTFPVTIPYSQEDHLPFESILKSLNPSKVTLLTHGYLSHIRKEGEYFYSIKDAILAPKSTRDSPQLVILVDWSALSGSTVFQYTNVVKNVPGVSKWLGKYVHSIRSVLGTGVYIHGIGFSLGAHLIGNCAEEAESLSSNVRMFDRITGLDPAGPAVVYKEGIWAFVDTRTKRLSKEHADMVDVIHTTDHLGTDVPLGTIDFYPDWGVSKSINTGYLDKASHIYALELFWKSVLNPEFFSTTTEIVDLKKKEVVQDQSMVRMGYYCQPGQSGMFYVDLGQFL